MSVMSECKCKEKFERCPFCGGDYDRSPDITRTPDPKLTAVVDALEMLITACEGNSNDPEYDLDVAKQALADMDKGEK
jgi:hypothetical protein